MQRNSKLAILGNFDLPGHTPKMIVSIWRNLWHLYKGKKSDSSSTFSLRFRKDVVNLFFWSCLALHIEKDAINLYNSFAFICRQKTNFFPMLFWKYCKDMATFYFGYFGYAWLHTSKMHTKNKLYNSLLSWDITL